MLHAKKRQGKPKGEMKVQEIGVLLGKVIQKDSRTTLFNMKIQQKVCNRQVVRYGKSIFKNET